MIRRRFKYFMPERNEFSTTGEETLLSVSEYYGVKPRSEAFEADATESRASSLEGYRKVQAGDFVMNYMLAWKGAYGVSDHDGIVSPAYAVFKINPRYAEPRYIHHRLRSEHMRSEFRARSKGIIESRLRLYPDSFLSMEIALPDLPTQKSIADFLDRETARIDQLIEKKQRFLEVARERWRATLNHAVFPNSPQWDRLPSGWRKVHLKYLTDTKRPIMYGIVLPGPNMEEGPMIVKGGDVKPGRLHPDRLCRTTPEIEASYVRSRLKAGDLVISIRGGIGDIEIVPPEIEGANLTQDAARIAPCKGVDREWLRYALLSSAVFHPLEARSLGAAVRGINIFDLKRVFVPEPPQDLQSEIADYLRLQEGNLLRLRSEAERHTQLLRELRAALITAAVTGQIDVAAWGQQGHTDRRLDRIEEALRA